MRISTLCCALAMLAGCDAPPATPPVAAIATPAAPFSAPMNPAAMSCGAVLASPAALGFASGWVTGQLRAASLTGRFPGPVPADAETAIALNQFCTQNPNAPLSAAVPALSAG